MVAVFEQMERSKPAHHHACSTATPYVSATARSSSSADPSRA
jgi:hypothetical protein